MMNNCFNISYPGVSGQGGGGGGKGGSSGGGVEAPDSLFSHQYAKVLDAISEGEIVGLVNGLQSVFLDDVPLMNTLGQYNYQGFSLAFRTGVPNQSIIQGFNAQESSQPISTRLKYGAPLIRSVLSNTVDSVTVSIGIPNLGSVDSNGNINSTIVSYSIEIKQSGGAWYPANLSSTRYVVYSNTTGIATTPIATSIIDVTATIALVSTWSSTGVANAAPTGTFVLEYAPISTGVYILAANLTLSRTLRPNGLVYAYDISVPSFSIPTAGQYLVRVRNSTTGTVYPCIVGCSTASYTYTINGKCTGKYISDHYISLAGIPNSGFPVDIRVTRLTPDSLSAKLNNETWWETFTERVEVPINYTNTAIAGLQIDARYFRGIPKRSYDCKLLKVKVPSNYFPEKQIIVSAGQTTQQALLQRYTRNATTGVDTGVLQVWDGTFYTAWTDNPVWCFYDMLTNTRYGLGSHIAYKNIGTTNLYKIAQYCDEPVQDGFGNYESRFTCNLYIQSRGDAYQVLNTMASVFRAMVYWDSVRGMTAVQDAPGSIIAQFTNANIIDGTFNYTGSASQARHTTALVTWNDPAEHYKQKVEFVENATDVSRFGVNQLDIPAIGCTSRGQAHRIGKWALFSESLETEIVHFKTGFEGLSIKPGDLIRTIDSFRAGLRYGGRIATVYPSIDLAVFTGIGSLSNTSLNIGIPYEQLTAYIDIYSIVTTSITLSIERVGIPQNIFVTQVIPAGIWSRVQVSGTLDSSTSSPLVKVTSSATTSLYFGKAQLNNGLTAQLFDTIGTVNKLTFPHILSNTAWVKVNTAITTTNTAQVTIDAPITLATGTTYTLSSQTAIGTLIDMPIVNTTMGSTQVLQTAPMLAQLPQEGAIWTVTSSVLNPETWRIMSIVEDQKGIYAVTALEHNTSKYDAIEKNLQLQVLNTSVITTVPTPVTNILVVGSKYTISPGVQGTKMSISWDKSPTAIKYIVSYIENANPLIELPPTANTSIEILSAVVGATYTITVTAYNALGKASP
jgi:predicted phage tail protein